jgi:hypothetical protein
MNATHRTLTGPNGLKVVLDANEIYPNDPGQGTPALVTLKVGDTEYTASFACASSEGELDCGSYQLNDDQKDWLASVEPDVDAWLTGHTQRLHQIAVTREL